MNTAPQWEAAPDRKRDRHTHTHANPAKIKTNEPNREEVTFTEWETQLVLHRGVKIKIESNSPPCSSLICMCKCDVFVFQLALTHRVKKHCEKQLSPTDAFVQLLRSTGVLLVVDGVSKQAACLTRQHLHARVNTRRKTRNKKRSR